MMKIDLGERILICTNVKLKDVLPTLTSGYRRELSTHHNNNGLVQSDMTLLSQILLALYYSIQIICLEWLDFPL